MKCNTKSYFRRKTILKRKKKEDIAIAKLFSAVKHGSVSEVEKLLKKYPELIDCTDVDMMTRLQRQLLPY